MPEDGGAVKGVLEASGKYERPLRGWRLEAGGQRLEARIWRPGSGGQGLEARG